MASPTTDRRFGLVGNTAIKAPVACATTANITLSGEQTIDGVLTSGSRVLVKNQTNTAENGIYDSSSAGWTRSADANGNYDLVTGTIVCITGGSTQANQFWEVSTTGTITIGTTGITWVVSLTASVSSLSYTAPGAGAVTRSVQARLRDDLLNTDYTNLSTAITAIGSTQTRLTILGTVALTADVTVPSTCELFIVQGGVITTTGHTLTINGPFVAPPVQCFAGSGSVTFAKGSTSYVLPEWWGAKGDSNTLGTTGTDSTTALQAALNVPTIPVMIGYGNYQFSNLTMPNEKSIIGTGIHSSNLICKSGSVGTMFTDQGSAAKITIRGVAFYGNNCSYTHGLYLGKTVAFGTEGLLDDLWVRDLPTGFPGIDVTGNVGHFGRIMVQDTGGLQIIGAANMVDKAQVYGSKGFTVSAISVGSNFQLTRIDSLEIEATATAVVPMYLTGNTAIGMLYFAGTDGATYPHLFEIGASCTTWRIDDLNFGFGATGYTVTNGNFKSGAQYFGSNASAKSAAGESNYASNYAGQRQQSFSVVITNTAAVMQHAIREPGGSVATNWAGLVNASSTTLQNTPTGADGATAMAFGGKIGSAATNTFWLDVADQRIADAQMCATIVFNSSGTALTCVPAFVSININGVTRNRLALQFYNATSGATFALTTANIAAGKIVQVLFNGVLS